jgi:phage shock protein C
MKNLKLPIAFLAGVALTLLLTWTVPSIHLLPTHPVQDDSDLTQVLGLIVLIVLVAFAAAAWSARGQGKFFQFLRDFRASGADCWLGGICGGLGQRTPIPAWIWRLAFAVTIFYYGAGLLVYFLMWIIIPVDESPIGQAQENPAPKPDTFFGFLHNLKRSSKDDWFGGVCGVLGEKTAAPAWAWRLGFAALILCLGVGFVAYLLMWIFVPLDEAKNHLPA